MKTTTIIFALYLLFKPLLPLVEYVVFYDYIKKELCINKEIPKSNCNGKCHLTKQLVNATDSENGNTTNHSFFEGYSLVFFQDITINYLDVFLKELQPTLNSSYNKIYKFYYIPYIFFPPRK